jgi:hypothetical protein
MLLAVMLAASALPRQVAAEVHPLVTRRILREQGRAVPECRAIRRPGRRRPIPAQSPTAALAAA